MNIFNIFLITSKLLRYILGTFIVSFVIYFAINLEANEIQRPALTAAIPAKTGTRTVIPDWLLDMPQLNDSPSIQWLDDKHLVTSLPINDANRSWKTEIINVQTGERRLLIEGSEAKTSPDGQWVVFCRGEGEEKQLWIISTQGTELKQLSHVPKGLGVSGYSYFFAWSPDSKQIALVHQLYTNYWELKVQPESHVDIIDVNTGQSNRIASFEASILYLSWFSNGQDLLFMKIRPGSEYNTEEDHTWIQSLNIKNKEVHTIMHFDGLQQVLQPTASPDGRFVAFMYDADNPMFNFMLSIGLVTPNLNNHEITPSVTRLTKEMKLGKPKWSSDSQSIYVLRRFGAYNQINVVNIKTSEVVQITNVPLVIKDYALSPDNTMLAWIGLDFQGTYTLSIATYNGEGVRDLLVIPSAPENVALSEVREIEWSVPNYPTAMRGLLFLPLNYQEGKRYPLIVDIHGGGSGASIYPEGGILLSTPLEWHMWTAKGYAVFVPEFRSSASFGALAITRDYLQEHDELNCDILDINAGVDALIENGIVDRNRLAVIGHSAGGARANWLTVATHRYNAVISKEGWADAWLDSLYVKRRSKRMELLFGGTPWEVPQNYQKNSALYHAAGATTPTLFLMGNPALGGADPVGTVRLLYNILNAQDVETQYVEYRDEGHVLEKKDNLKDALLRSIQWIDDHLGENLNSILKCNIKNEI